MNEDSAETSQIHFGWKTKKSPKKGVRLNLGIIAAIYVKLRDEVIRVKDLVGKRAMLPQGKDTGNRNLQTS